MMPCSAAHGGSALPLLRGNPYPTFRFFRYLILSDIPEMPDNSECLTCDEYRRIRDGDLE